MGDTIFDKIVRGDISAYKIWEDNNYLAFLTPFPNTPGATVVIPKTNHGDYVFTLPPDQLSGLVLAAQKVANLLEKAFEVEKVALVFEGEGIPYVHAKLYPMHGEFGEGSGHEITDRVFFEEYQGFITTIEGPTMPDEQLRAIQQKIAEANT